MCPWPRDSSRKLLSMNARLDYRLHVSAFSAFKRCEGEQSGYLVFSVFTSYHSSRI